ncbi:hypothetical protein [Nocardioides sp. SYSU D00038]|uniref:hypothetical protein n=1 Tax=Nocardioides sp. SYSU D00038 TaxID=2812554 RepID=UPI0019672A06|nr:hypothetical protein [Nocardioides sp. SYSU D00038]
MTALVLVELLRLRWRRAVLLLVAAAFVIPAILLATTLWGTRPVSDAELRSAQEQAAAAAESPQLQLDIADCEADPEGWGVDASTTCEEMLVPQASWYAFRQPLDLDQERQEGSGLAVAALLTMLLVLVGTTFVGHDWNSGSMSNQLLFEPRRTRVWLAKAVAVLGGSLMVALLVLLAFWTGLVVASNVQGLTLRDGEVAAAYKQAVLAACLASLAATFAHALTMLFRSTVATLGVLFAFAVAGSIVLAALGFDGYERLLPHANFIAFVVGSYDYYVTHGAGIEAISRSHAAVYFAVVLALAVAASLASFRSRDVP